MLRAAFVAPPDSRGPAAKRPKLTLLACAEGQPEPDLPGIVAGHLTFGKGRKFQLSYGLNSKYRNPTLCVAPCPMAGKKTKGKHSAGCEHAIIFEAQKRNKLHRS
jgi:hypothetical protein